MLRYLYHDLAHQNVMAGLMHADLSAWRAAVASCPALRPWWILYHCALPAFSLAYQRSSGASPHLTLSSAARGWAFKPSQLPVTPGASPTGPNSGQREQRRDWLLLSGHYSGQSKQLLDAFYHTHLLFYRYSPSRKYPDPESISLTFKNMHCNAALWCFYF